MKIQIKKKVLEDFKRKISENKSSRGDKQFDKTVGFYGNYGSVKSFNAFDEDADDLPVQPGAHMSQQLSVESPPVEDPDYIPGTSKELGLALTRIAKEVPFSKIEYYYRKSHDLLDSALDDHDISFFNEAIDYDAIPNPLHRKQIKDLIDQSASYTTRIIKPLTIDKAALFAIQNRNVARHPNISLQDVIDEIEMHINNQKESEDQAKTDDVFVNPPDSLQDITPDKTQKKRKKKKEIIRSKPEVEKKPAPRQQNVSEPSIEGMDKRAEDEMMHMLASAYSEYTEMEDYAKTWDWKGYKEDAPYLKVMFDLIKILHQLSYRVLQANYINKYGGYVYDPEAEQPGGKKGGFVLEKSGPTSRPEAQAMMIRINSDFGLTYDNMMRQQNILKMNHAELVEVIERAMVGIFQRVPALYTAFMGAVSADMQKRNLGGTKEEVGNEAFSFIANVLSHKYRGESEILDRDLVNVAIAGIFKRCLLDLPAELGIGTKVGISLDALGKKKTKTINKVYGFNLAGATKRFEKLSKDPKIAKEIKKLMPKLILNKILETRTANVTKKGGLYNFEDKSTGLGYQLKTAELKTKIKEYIAQRLAGKKPSFDEEQAAVETDLETDTYDPNEEEKAAQKRLSKDNYEVRKMVKEMEKMISSGDWMHIAPLFGFSGAPGVRSWYLRYPERKFNIMMAAKKDNPPAGAKRYMKVFRQMRENLGNNLITLYPNKPGVLDLMIDEISSKSSGMSTSDQAMIELLEEMKGDVEELINLYYNADSYEDLERNKPEELKRLSNTAGGSLLRFGIGAVFDKIIKDIDKEWHTEMKTYLEIKNGLPDKAAHDLAYYFTGLKVKPSKGDFNQDKGKLSNAAMAFASEGIQAEEFFKALRYSQKWLFSTLDRELNKDFKGDNYYKMVKELAGTPLYKTDNKSKSGFKLDKKVYKIIKGLIDGKKGAISSYLDNLAIEQFQQETKKKLDKIKSEKPDLFLEFKKVIKEYIR